MLLQQRYREDFDDIWRGLRSGDPKRKASSLERIETFVLPPLRNRVLAIVGEETSARTSGQLSFEAVIREIIVRGSRTMRTLASYRAQELGIDLTPSQREAAEQTRLSAFDGLAGRRVVDRPRIMLGSEALRATRTSRAPA